MVEDFSDLEPKGLETIPSNKIKQKFTMEKFEMEQQNKLGVEATVKVIKFMATAYDGVAEALKEDNKISVLEGFGLAAKLVPQALSLPGALPYVVNEVVFDKISEDDALQLVGAFDGVQNLVGDPKEAVKELIPILADLKNWGFKWFGK
jgi:hypothetical protein